MKFKFKISKLANQFFFISNLSEWHFSCRKDYNQEWLKWTWPLTDKEQKGLEDFKKIMENHGFIRNRMWKTKYMGQYFYINQKESDVWNNLKKSIDNNDFKKIKNIFNVFTPRFEKIWKRSQKNLSKEISYFKQYLKSKEGVKFFKDLRSFINPKSRLNKFKIVVISSPLKGEAVTAAGSANLNNEHVTFEIPQLKFNSWEFEYSVGILAHEIGHILLDDSGGYKIIKGLIKKLKLPKFIFENIEPKFSTHEFINELLIELFVPYGYLAHQQFKKFNLIGITFSVHNLKNIGANFEKFKKYEKVSAYRLQKFIFWQFYPLLVNHIKNGGIIDKNFIKNFIKFVISSTKKNCG